MSERQCPADPHERPCFGGDHACCSTPDHPAADAREGLSEGEVEASIKAQNPDLETAWLTIAWWQQTCAYWYDEAHKGYALRDSQADLIAAAEQRGAEEVKARWAAEFSKVADEFDELDSEGYHGLGGCSFGGVVRHSIAALTDRKDQ